MTAKKIKQQNKTKFIGISFIIFLTISGCKNDTENIKKIICKSPLSQEAMDRMQAIQVGNMRTCKDSGLDYMHKITFIYKDLDAKTSEYATSEIETCWGYFVSEKLKIQTTPTHVSFAGSDSVFNIDRSTLVGGYLESKNYTCELLSVEVKKMKL